MMFVLKNLIENEYFPAELPPCFSNKAAADNADKIVKWLNNVNQNGSIPTYFNGFKSENSRRIFSVPNVYHYFKAASCIVEHSEEISKVLKKSTISISKPIDKKPRKDVPYEKLGSSIKISRDIIERCYQNNRYQVRLDINNFFGSIYTHSISWVMHGKKEAKKSKGKNFIGDKIDKCISDMNYRQTNGILIGNAISRIISEIILCSIDLEIQQKFKNITVRRYVDDYYIFIKESHEVENIISFIRNSLAKYELNLNENKIQILESPFFVWKTLD